MKKTEQQLADELEQMVTAVMQGKTPPADETQTNEARLAANLIDLSAQTNPDPGFVAQLQRRLSARARQLKKSKPAPEQASFWRDLSQMLKEGFTMKRTVALGAILTIIVLFGAVALGRGLLPGSDTPQVAQATPVPAETLPEMVTTTDTAVSGQPLAQLPRFEAQSPGFGGGGDGTASADAPMPTEEFDLKMMDPFSGTTFTLNGTLPIEPVSGFVQQRQPQVELSPEQAQAIANQYGFTGPLYVETYPSDVPEDAPPPVYIVFDGPRNLRLDAWAINYTDEVAVAAFDYENPSLTIRPEIVPVAEAFLAQRGQLNFPYVAEAQLGDTVAFYRLVDGRKVNEAELSVSVNPNNEVAYVWDNTSTEWTAVGTYPLISAEQAWQRVLGGVFENNIQFQTIMPDTGVALPIEEPDYLADYKYWGREFTPNSEVHLYEWAVVYQPLDGGAPLVKIRGFNVIADEATLNALADGRDQQLHVWGTLNEDKTLFQLAGWEALAEYTPVFQVGVVRWQGDELRFYGEDGSIYILPNAPADIAEGLKVNLFGYGVRDTGLEYPVLDWESIDKYIEYPEPELLPAEGEGYPADGDVTILPIDGPFVPFRYGQVTVNDVELVFFITYAFPDVPEGEEMMMRSAPTIYLQPAWAFTGTADNGDTIKLFVQAVADEYLQP